jgi:hypothetical protein
MIRVHHQFSLFDFNATKPKAKVPISAARIKEVQAFLEKGDGKNAAIKLRELHEGLERFYKTL